MLTSSFPSANSNSIRTAFWLVYETIRSPSLAARARAAVVNSQTSSTTSCYPSALCSSPLLQFLYAETLRIRSALMILRNLSEVNLRLDNWLIPCDSIATVMTHFPHHDEQIWNTGTFEDPHPLNQFWADRFLIYSGELKSGPLRCDEKLAKTDEKPLNQLPCSSTNPSLLPQSRAAFKPSSIPTFSTEGLAGTWIPFGGGQNICPGRYFAKQEIILTPALLLTSCDIELLEEKKYPWEWWSFWKTAKRGPKVDLGSFGSGVYGVVGESRCRLRRRA